LIYYIIVSWPKKNSIVYYITRETDLLGGFY